MGFPGLNLPQQVPAPQGAVGGVIGPNPTAQNRTPAASQIVQGMAQLMQGFVQSKQATQKHYGDLYDQAAQEIAAGLNPNPDYKKLASWARLSGRPYNTDLTPAEAQAQTQMNQYQQVQNSIAQGQQGAQDLASQTSGLPPQSPGAMGSPGQPGVAAPGIAPPVAAPQATPPGFMDRLRLGLGMTPSNPNVARPSAMSPAMQNLQALNTAAQTAGGAPGQLTRGLQDSVLASNVKRAAGVLGITHDQSMVPVYSQMFGKALNGDLQANTMLQRLNIFKGVPIDEVANLYKSEQPGISDFQANQKAASMLLWQQGGGQQLILRGLDMAKDFVPRFGGTQDPMGNAQQYVMSHIMGTTYNGPPPSRTPEEFDKYSSALKPILDRFPNAPPNLTQMYGDAKMANQNELANNLLDFMSQHYKSTGQVQQSQFQQGLSKDYAQIASNNELGNTRNDNEALGFYTRAVNELSETDRSILSDPKATEKYTQKQINDAAADLNDKQSKLAGTVVKINGQEQQLAPLSAILNRNNIDTRNTPFMGMGPFYQRNVLPTPGPAGGQPQIPHQSLSPQDLQLLGMPGGSMQPQGGSGLGQLLMQRAMGQQ